MSLRNYLVRGPDSLSDLSGRTQKIAGTLQPEDRSEVIAIVQAACREKAKLQPISCGRNWGFGSRLPEEPNVFLLDLSRLQAIRQIDWTTDFAELEPGVTQGVLDDSLAQKDRSHYFNVTGAGRQTSIIGNSLERGIGYFGSRKNDLLDLEVVLGDGSCHWMGDLSNNPLHTGLGPELKGFFLQSNFAVVTAAKFKLRRRPACMGVVLASLAVDRSINEFIDRVAEMRREDLFHSVPHVGNRQRLFSTFGPVGSTTALNLSSNIPEWTCALPVSGPKAVVPLIFQEIAHRLEGVASCQLISPDLSPVEPRFANLVDLALGVPNDFALSGVANAALNDPIETPLDLDAGRAGLIHITPTCRAEGGELKRLLALIEDVRVAYRLGEIPMTLNLVNSGMITVVISLPFDREHSTSQLNIRKGADQLLRNCAREGFLPYRLGVSDGALLERWTQKKSDLLGQLRNIFDPYGVFAKSKYESLWSNERPARLHKSLPTRVAAQESTREVCV